MKKVLHVVSNRGSRNPLKLAPTIEEAVENFISERKATLESFNVVSAKLQEDGYGQALITIDYSLNKVSPSLTKGGDK